jgi:hypothetical protein
MYKREDWSKIYDALIQDQMQSQRDNTCQLKDELGSEIDELWKLMRKHSKRILGATSVWEARNYWKEPDNIKASVCIFLPHSLIR